MATNRKKRHGEYKKAVKTVKAKKKATGKPRTKLGFDVATLKESNKGRFSKKKK